ncbi:hypothetical protein [Salmonirosea aquatica]|uniref:Uncharacterized protein n=1 Tax=Salmonirosea aquatica TaxID=2654236 RepID=A0A7C9FCV4_9BACT|nr:hypothetical protein [Cytophagaceae bacterium SJW1-29]
MNDNELDDLFRSNADYLADQPPRDFDKDAFWQHLQTAIPRKAAPRKKSRVWGWAAAAVLLAGMFGGIWWIYVESEVENQKWARQAEKTPVPKSTERIARVPQEIPSAVESKKSRPQSMSPQKEVSQEKGTPPRYPSPSPEKAAQEVPLRSPLPEKEPVSLAIKEFARPDTLTGVDAPMPEVAPVFSGKPTYRVVHINEIRERKQQEAKARTRIAFRIGLPSASRVTTQSDHLSPLSIPIQN